MQNPHGNSLSSLIICVTSKRFREVEVYIFIVFNQNLPWYFRKIDFEMLYYDIWITHKEFDIKVCDIVGKTVLKDAISVL